MKKYWYIILIVLGIIAYIVTRTLKTESSRLVIDELKLKLPIISGTTVKVITTRFTRTLSTLMSSGMPLIQALEIVSKVVGNRVAEKGIIRAIEEIKKGAGLAGPIRNVGVFPAMVCSMISIGEESGTLDEILEKTASYFDDEVEAAIQKLTTMLEPLMIVVMAVLIGAIVIAMVMPMFEMMNTIKM